MADNLPDNGVINKIAEPLSFLPSTDVGEYFLWEIRNREKFILEMGGEKVKLLKRKWEGTRCAACWDDVRKTGEADCEACFGTGVENGFLSPLDIMVSFVSPNVRQITIQEHGMRKMLNLKNWMLWEPQIINKDIIVKKNGERIWVTDVTQTLFRGLILHQDFNSELIEHGNVIYKIPVGEFI